MTEDENAVAGRLIERLLVDPVFRAEFRRDPVGACVVAGLPGLAGELGGGVGSGMETLELRESRSSLAGVVMAAAVEGLSVAEAQAFVEHGAKGLHGVRVPGRLGHGVRVPPGWGRCRGWSTRLWGGRRVGCVRWSMRRVRACGRRGRRVWAVGVGVGVVGGWCVGGGSCGGGGFIAGGWVFGCGVGGFVAGGWVFGGGAGGSGAARVGLRRVRRRSGSCGVGVWGGFFGWGAGGWRVGGGGACGGVGCVGSGVGGVSGSGVGWWWGGAAPGSGLPWPDAPGSGGSQAGGVGGVVGSVPSGSGGAGVAGAVVGAGGGVGPVGVSGLLEAPGLQASAQARAFLASGGVDPRVVSVLDSVLAHHSVGVADVVASSSPVHVQALDIVSVDGQPVGPDNFAARDLVTEIAAMDSSPPPARLAAAPRPGRTAASGRADPPVLGAR